MATAIPDEAIDKFRRLEARAEAAHAKSEALRHRIDGFRNDEANVRTNLHNFFAKAAVKGRLEITDEGTISHIIGDTAVVLSEKNPTAARLKKVEGRIAATKAEAAEHSQASSPIRALTAACREHLKTLGWDGL